MNISEYVLTKHYLERKQERSQILKVNVAAKALEGYDAAKAKQALKKVIQEKLDKALSAIESSGTNDARPSNVFKIITAFQPIVVRDGVEYTVTLEVNTSKIGKGSGKVIRSTILGHVFVCVLRGGTLTTLMLLKEDENKEETLKNHAKRIAGSNFKIVVPESSGYKYTFDIKEVMEGKKVELETAGIQKKDLPYRVKTDYRKGANFIHDEYGIGTIVNTSSGIKGQPNQQGKLDWVDVDFGMYVKSKVKYKYRRINRVYANAYWLGKK